MNLAIIAIIIVILTIIALIIEVFPVAVTAMLSAIIMSLLGIISYKDVFSGFSKDTTILMAGSMIIGATLVETGIARDLTKLLNKNVAKSEKFFVATLIIISGTIAAFVSNTATVLMFIPVLTSITENSDGRLKLKNLLLPLVIATRLGGIATLIGAPCQMIANGILNEYGLEGFKMLDFARFGIPLLILYVIYSISIGYKRINKFDDNDSVTESNKVNNILIKNDDKRKKIITLIIFMIFIVGLVTEIVPNGIIAVICSLLCIITKCIDGKKAIGSINLATICFVAGSLGFCKGMESSGASELITNKILLLPLAKLPDIAILAIILFITIILTNMISSTALITLLTPIGIMLAQNLGIDVKAMILTMALGSNISFLSPVASPPMTLITSIGNYKVKEIMKVGIEFAIISYVFIVLMLFFTVL